MNDCTTPRQTNTLLKGLTAIITFGWAVHAQADDWTAPEVVADNPVLEIVQSRWLGRNGGISLLGTGDNYYLDDEWNSPTDAFWQSVLDADTEGLLEAAQATDTIGMSYWPPFTVWFPKRESLAQAMIEIPDTPASRAASEWWETDRRVLVFDFSDFFEHTPNMIGIYFKLDEAADEQPNHCHARQIITILYTGETDEPALRDCLLTSPNN